MRTLKMAFKKRPKDRQLIALLSLCLLAIAVVVPVFGAWAQSSPLRAKLQVKTQKEITVGAARFDKYLPLLEGKRIAVVANQTSEIAGIHLVDTLLAQGVNIKKVFAPEHGFRGIADAGEHVQDAKDAKTGLEVVSLYGKNKKPSAEIIEDVDVLIFDIQDVGARFYTYISTMAYVMEAAAENNKQVIVLDRPNPNGFYVDGPVLKEGNESFVGLHPIPVVHGMTVGEYARMVNKEGWLKNGVSCQLTVVRCKGYAHVDLYQLPIKPSPNLPNMASIYLYPSLAFFEGTVVSIGRGTDKPFQLYGHPDMKGDYRFKPVSMSGAKYPPLENQNCKGYLLDEINADQVQESGLNLEYILRAYQEVENKESFFLENNFIRLLAGSESLKADIIAGKKEEEIKKSWQGDIEKFKEIRKKYLLYKDFE